MQKIIPHLWFDKEAKEAAEFYTSLFPDSEITNISTIHDTPSGDCDIVSFKLWGYAFMAISAGPEFKFNPSISFMVNFDPARDKDAERRINDVWTKLSDGGTVLMPLDKYPFSERYGWIQDKYGLSWQLILTDPEGEVRPAIIPCMLFTDDVCGKAEEALNYYVSVFGDAKIGTIARYPDGMEPDKEGTIMFSDFRLQGQWLVAMDSGREHGYGFNEAVSLLVNCDTQEELDGLWETLSAVPESEQCGWLTDKYGVSWQLSPVVLDKMMRDPDPRKVARVTQAFLKMKKLDIAKLEEAYNNEEHKDAD